MLWLLLLAEGVVRRTVAFEGVNLADLELSEADVLSPAAPKSTDAAAAAVLESNLEARESDPVVAGLLAKEHDDEAEIDVEPPELVNGSPDVEITWIRHGLSCANANAKYTSGTTHIKAKAIEYWMKDSQDPPLSDCGMHRSSTLGANLDPRAAFDWVGSSALLRAIQTAALEFPAAQVHVLPFLSEKGGHNRANTQDPDQPARLAEYTLEDGRTLLDRVDYTHLDKASADHRAERSETRTWQFRETLFGPHNPTKRFSNFDPSMDEALAFIAAEVLPGLREAKPEGTLKLAIVSHSIFMGSELPCRSALDQEHRNERDRKKPRNNEALSVTYALQANGVLGPTGCTMAAEGLENPATLCARDVATCPNHIVVPLAEECLCGTP